MYRYYEVYAHSLLSGDGYYKSLVVFFCFLFVLYLHINISLLDISSLHFTEPTREPPFNRRAMNWGSRLYDQESIRGGRHFETVSNPSKSEREHDRRSNVFLVLQSNRVIYIYGMYLFASMNSSDRFKRTQYLYFSEWAAERTLTCR